MYMNPTHRCVPNFSSKGFQLGFIPWVSPILIFRGCLHPYYWGCLGRPLLWLPGYRIADTLGSVLVVIAGVAAIRWARAGVDFWSRASWLGESPVLAFRFDPYPSEPPNRNGCFRER